MKKIFLKQSVFLFALVLITVGFNRKVNKTDNVNKTVKVKKDKDLLKTKKELLNQTLNWVWAKGATGTKKVGDILGKKGESLVTDSKGFIYVLGKFHGETIKLDNIISNKVGDDSWNSFFTKYDANGKVLWVKIIKENDNGMLTIDSKDNIYISCDTSFISKYDTEGNLIWKKNNSMSNTEIAVNAPDCFYLVGGVDSDINVVKYDSMGNILWSKVIKASGGYKRVQAHATIDNLGNLYVAGDFNSNKLIVDDNVLNTHGNDVNKSDGFIVKYDSSGNVIFAKNIGGGDGKTYTTVDDIVTDIEGNMYVTGVFFGGNILIGNTVLHYEGSQKVFIIKYDKNFNVLWAKYPKGSNDERFPKLAIDKFGNVYITGFSWSDIVYFGNIKEFAKDGNINFITKYNSNGNELCSKSISNLKGTKKKVFSRCNDINTDRFGNVYVTGYFEDGGVKFGNAILSEPPRDETFFIAKLSSK